MFRNEIINNDSISSAPPADGLFSLSSLRIDGQNISFRLTVPSVLYRSVIELLNNLMGVAQYMAMKVPQLEKIELAHSLEYKEKMHVRFDSFQTEVLDDYDRQMRRGLSAADSIRKTKSIFNNRHGSKSITCEQIRLLVKSRSK